ncbi:hypothetical protein JTB14_004414 [Gonioctena quinquepunctata]|nr:hypothetical protein JTB14_004414 [Gonioctena quinquepunctata]
MNKPVIICGEASETDSEDDSNLNLNNAMTKSVQGAIITGEDSESENDIETTTASTVSAWKQMPQEKNDTYNSLFHQKLRECNGQLHNDIQHICQNTLNDANRNLNMIEQQLLRSQLTMQNAVTSLKTLSINSLTIKSKLHSLLSSNFLSNISVNK